MATALFEMRPWEGGLNTAVDVANLPPDQLTIAENILFGSNGSRKLREGMSYWGAFRTLSRSSTGTTRTIKIQGATSFTVGSTITVLGRNSDASTNRAAYMGTYVLTAVATTTYTNDTISYVAADSLTESATSDTTFAVVSGGAYLTSASRSSTGTTRSIVVTDGSFSIGDVVTVVGGPADYNGTHTITAVATSGPSGSLHDTISWEATSSLSESTTADTSMKVSVNDMDSSVVGLYDFWRNQAGAKLQATIGVTSNIADGRTKLYSYSSSGVRTQIPLHPNASDFGQPVTQASFETANEMLIMGFNGALNTPKLYNPISEARLQNVAASVPNFSIVRKHLGRLWANEKNNPDLLHYCETDNPTVWMGLGDSGALPLGTGDGDPEGLTAIFPSFKGVLFVAKRNKLIKVSGDAPENFFPDPVSDGVGCVSHNSVVAVDQDTIYYCSDKGFHELSATANYGDFNAAFASKDIQPTFNDFASGRLKFIQGVYISALNSVVWAVSGEGQESNSDLYFYNTQGGRWYQWPEVSCQAVLARMEGNKKRLYLGTSDNTVIQTQNSTQVDFGTNGLAMRVRSGYIYPDGSSRSTKAFKKLTLYYRTRGDYSFTARVKIDNFPWQTLTFSGDGEFDPLGPEFILGSSVLGTSSVLAPVTFPIDGYGHGIMVEVEHTASGQDLELFGYAIEFEPAGVAQETNTGG